jgi:predicted small metal-binding protein
MTDTETVRTRVEISRETRRHLGIMAAETGATMSGIVEDLIENYWEQTGHTAEYSARYAGTHAYTTHADERRALIIEMYHGGMSVEQIVNSLPHHLKTTHSVVESIISDDDADLVEQMRKGAAK